MRRLSRLLVFAALCALAAPVFAATPQVGDAAPTFRLQSDVDRAASSSYGVLTSYKGQHYARRTTFLIDPRGRVAKIYVDVDPEQNSSQVLGDLASLKAAR